MRGHSIFADREIVVYAGSVVSMRLIEAFDTSQVVRERVRIEVGGRLPDLIPGTLFQRDNGEQGVA